MLKMQFSMASNFTLQPLRRYDMKPTQKTPHALVYIWRDMPDEKNNTRWARTYVLWIPAWYSSTEPLSHLRTDYIKKLCTYFLSNFTTSVIFRIIRSKAKILKFNVNLLLIKGDDFFCTYEYMNTLWKLRTLISVHIIGCRKTKLSMERKMFPVCGPRNYICISVVFRDLRNFPEVFRRLPNISGGFTEISGGFPNENRKE